MPGRIEGERWAGPARCNSGREGRAGVNSCTVMPPCSMGAMVCGILRFAQLWQMVGVSMTDHCHISGRCMADHWQIPAYRGPKHPRWGKKGKLSMTRPRRGINAGPRIPRRDPVGSCDDSRVVENPTKELVLITRQGRTYTNPASLCAAKGKPLAIPVGWSRWLCSPVDRVWPMSSRLPSPMPLCSPRHSL